MGLKEEFLNCNVRLDEAVAMAFPLCRNMQDVVECLKNYVGKQTYTKLMKLRNIRKAVLSFSADINTEVEALCDGDIRFLTNIIERINDSPKVHDIYKRLEQTYVCDESAKVDAVMDMMIKKNCSNVPILGEGNIVIGVFGEATPFTMIRNGLTKIGAVTLSKIHDIVSIESNKPERFPFVAKSASLCYLRKLFAETFNKGIRVDICFVTEHGVQNEPLLGIVTAWDFLCCSDCQALKRARDRDT